MFWNLCLLSIKCKIPVLLCAQVRNLRSEHFESYPSFSYCMHSSVYRVFWPSDRVVDCIILNVFRHPATGPEHPLYRTMRIVVYSVIKVPPVENSQTNRIGLLIFR